MGLRTVSDQPKLTVPVPPGAAFSAGLAAVTKVPA